MRPSIPRAPSGPAAPMDSAGAEPGSVRTHLVAGASAVVAAFLASLCCIGPVLFVTLGVGAGLASRFEPLRPLFTVLTLALLGVAFYATYGRRRGESAETCSTGAVCATPGSRRRPLLLWSATVIALLILTFPQWSLLFV